MAALCLILCLGCSSPDEREPASAPPRETPKTAPKPASLPLPPAGESGTTPEGEIPPGNIEEILDTRFQERSYRLRARDIIYVNVYDHADLCVRLRVPEEGPVRFPLIGDLEVLNRPHDEIEEEIRKRLEKDYVALAPVSILLEKTHESTAYILGQVARQGEYLFPPNQELNLLQLVAKAGGFLDDADKERLRLIRGRGPSRKYWVLSVGEIEKAGRIGLDVALRDGDTLMVPTLPKIHVLGGVKRPGALRVRSGTRETLAGVLAQAGGFAEDANQEEILILRGDGKGKTRTYTVSFRPKGPDGPPPGDLEIVPGDTVLVPCAAKIYVLGAVTRPGGFASSEEDLTATKAISLAGGFSRRADSNGTVVIRAVEGGQKVIRVRVKSIVSSESEEQVRLEPGDIVFVPERFF